MDWGLFILLLLCPLMMIFMMKGHSHGNHGQSKHGHEQHNEPREQVQSENDIKKLEAEIDFLRNQNETLQQEIKKHTS